MSRPVIGVGGGSADPAHAGADLGADPGADLRRADRKRIA